MVSRNTSLFHFWPTDQPRLIFRFGWIDIVIEALDAEMRPPENPDLRVGLIAGGHPEARYLFITLHQMGAFDPEGIRVDRRSFHFHYGKFCRIHPDAPADEIFARPFGRDSQDITAASIHGVDAVGLKLVV